MTAPGTFTAYSTVSSMLGTLPAWVEPEEQERIASYQKYEEMYWSSEEGYQAVLRGDNENPVFMPTAKTIVNTVNRYVGNDLTLTYEPTNEIGTDEDVAVTRLAFEQLFRRERFRSKYNGNKRYGLIRGDWLFHVYADPEKPLGRRISIEALDPAAFFPVWDEEDPNKIIKIHIAEQFDDNGSPKVNRLTYEKVANADGTNTIIRSQGIFAMEEWWNLENPERVIYSSEALPPEITAFPVYHFKNFDDTAPYGSSELRGIESVLIGINQTMSDEDLTLSVEGLGIWATDGAGPVDENGDEVDWVWGAGRVLTHAGGLKRLNGTASVVPYGDHYERLQKAAREASGATDAATGNIQSAEAESGVALLLKLGPMLSMADEKDEVIRAVLTQMFHDLCQWLAVYEELPLLTADGTPRVAITPVFGPKIPVNRKQVIDEVVSLRNAIPPLISLQTAHSWMRAAGIEVPATEIQTLEQEAAGNYDPLNEPGTGEEAEQEDRRASEAPVPAGEE